MLSAVPAGPSASDFVTSHVRNLIANNRGIFDDRSRRLEQLRKPLLARVGAGLSERIAAETLECYLCEIESDFSRIARRRSRGYWIYLSRSVPVEDLSHQGPWSSRRSRSALNLAIIKYGASGGTFVDQRSDILSPAEITRDIGLQDVADVLVLIALAYEHEATGLAVRRIGAGAALKVKDGAIDTPTSAEVTGLLRLLDNRIKRHQDFAAAPGTSARLTIPPGATPDYGWIAYPEVNTERQPLGTLSQFFHYRPSAPTNFYPVVIHAAETRNVLLRFAEEVRALTGVEPDELLSVLWAINYITVLDADRSLMSAHEFLQRGSFIVGRGLHRLSFANALIPQVQRWWTDAREDVLSWAQARSVVRRVAGHLTYSASELESISVWDRTPIKLAVPGDHQELWDVSGIHQYLIDLVQAVISGDGDTGTKKGRQFEGEVEHRVRQPGVSKWDAPEELAFLAPVPDPRRPGHMLRLRELDLALVVGDKLWIIECKAWGQDWRVRHGEYTALHKRWEELEKSLAQAESLAAILQHTRTGTNYSVPASVKQFDFCVCTPAAELIPTREPRFWISPDVPRILTPSELTQVLRGEVQGR